MGFWQVSDKVPSLVITAVTKHCNEENCCVSARWNHSTLMGTSDYYDKNGKLNINDDNNGDIILCCKKCWTEWEVNKQNDNVKILSKKDLTLTMD